VKKSKAHRDKLKSAAEKAAKKRKKEESATKSNIPAVQDLPADPYPWAAVSGDDNHCRLCGKEMKRAVRCNGCEAMVCYKCSKTTPAQRKQEKTCWICQACEIILTA